jgi:hypothetical protein
MRAEHKSDGETLVSGRQDPPKFSLRFHKIPRPGGTAVRRQATDRHRDSPRLLGSLTCCDRGQRLPPYKTPANPPTGEDS